MANTNRPVAPVERPVISEGTRQDLLVNGWANDFATGRPIVLDKTGDEPVAVYFTGTHAELLQHIKTEGK
jgi:hypothetical protein